jgi:hypothetical protein
MPLLNTGAAQQEFQRRWQPPRTLPPFLERRRNAVRRSGSASFETGIADGGLSFSLCETESYLASLS